MPDPKPPTATTPRWLSDERPKKPPWKRGGLPYLAEPNYYRMGYQLAVELLDGSERKYRAPSAPDPKAIVERMLADANQMLEWYGDREYRGKWQFWKRLEAPEKRLRDFLLKTIRPCLEILDADICLGRGKEVDPGGMDGRLSPLRLKADNGSLAYRPLYNLAYYEARRGRVGPAVRYLIAALRGAPPSRRAALLARAENDTTLRAVVTDRAFEAQRNVFDPAPKKPPAPRKRKSKTKKPKT